MVVTHGRQGGNQPARFLMIPLDEQQGKMPARVR